MAKGKLGRTPPRKSSTPSSTLVFSLLLMLSVVVLILLALGIVSLPTSNSATSRPVHDLNNIVHSTVHRFFLLIIFYHFWNWILCQCDRIYCDFCLIVWILYFFRVEVSKEKGEQWVEFLSWEPRAVVYHNFLVCVLIHLLFYFDFRWSWLFAFYSNLILNVCSLDCDWNLVLIAHVLMWLQLIFMNF